MDDRSPTDRSPAGAERVFLLSPAHCAGKRAGILCRDAADFALARQVRTATGAPLGEVFSFMSGLYFRGKLAYARAFAAQPSHALIITPTDGLLEPDTPIATADLARYAAVAVDEDEPRYRLPLVRAARRLARTLSDDVEVVLLGSIATRKYLHVLQPIFGARLCVPRDFIGRGDMSRGALLLHAVRASRELEYLRVDSLLDGSATSGSPRHTSRRAGSDD